MTKVKAWISAFRLRTLPLALSSIIMGGFLAAYYDAFNWIIFLLASLTTLFLQVLSNLANDYGDTVNGADHEERKGPARMVQSGLIALKSMRHAIVLFSILSFITGLALIVIAFGSANALLSLLFILLGIAAIAAAMKYTMGNNPYGYNGLGDFYVLLFFGLVGVAGSFYLYMHEIRWEVLLPASSVGFLSAGVLNLNNMRDEQSDKMANKNTLVVKKGINWAKKYHYSLVVGALLLSFVFVLFGELTAYKLLFLLSLPLFIRHLIVVNKAKESKAFDPELKKLALSTLIYVILFGVGLILG
ncbi:1,4-dihydroxy-2-naphthoate polyprenyltransferase [Carboxylicivirga sp. A043]|uniref:1,4-dihydroxy-2-naphthoate polyprenyltransferase n=1 Tax=Carboxylicivirga litoralis TaxID=2816963 RepID=UPI0021CB1ABE|nr:1,4-dihydroxy-2-naphthoate polyprenyltransferase [Carboxylicivirga sp. A043]MCU4156943.1 1,4-dihydroxy-2-naphthoate polyprenyltransferase [Carboxylicivirga sp. A043]